MAESLHCSAETTTTWLIISTPIQNKKFKVKKKNTGVGSHSLLQGTFLTQELNPCLLHYRQILYHLKQPGKSQTSG